MKTNAFALSTGLKASLSAVAGSLLGVLYGSSLYAAGEIDTVLTSDQPATPLQYQIGDREYRWGQGRNQQIDGFVYRGFNYRYVSVAADVRIRRVDRPGLATGQPCSIFAERSASDADALLPDYPTQDASGNCDMAAVLTGRTINRGTHDTFGNSGSEPNNIERIDYVFPAGLITPVAAGEMDSSGHMIAELGGDSLLQVAAILALDSAGEPAAYGPLVQINAAGCSDPQICYGLTDLRHDYSVLRSNSIEPQGHASHTGDTSGTVGMAFVSVGALGLNSTQTYYGVSYFPPDVDVAQHNLTDPTTFPSATSQFSAIPGDSADIYGGTAAYFLLGSVSVAIGHVFIDQNANGLQDSGEQGIGDISLTLFEDSNGNGVLDGGDSQIGLDLISDQFGNIVVPALPIGQYIMELDEQDPQLPAGIVLANGTNPFLFTVIPGGVCDINFAYEQNTDVIFDASGTTSGDGGDANGNSDGDGSGDGAVATGSDEGGSSAGSATSGNTDGADDSGATGGADGGSDSGSETGGSTGADSAGTSTSGDTTSGATTSGNSTAGSEATSGLEAVADTATVGQGQSVTIDVLANDLDPSSGGLTIVAVESAGNGTVEIVGNMIAFDAPPGFVGETGFTYTIEDSTGEQASGTVDVLVERFSDINDNNINDFDECECDDLRLITGLHGSGVGGGGSAGAGAEFLLQWLLLPLLLIRVFFVRLPYRRLKANGRGVY